MRNYFNYFTEIEEHFARKRGKSLLVSPLDWCLIELWRDSGIPLHIAIRGIDAAFDAVERSGRKAPSTLYYCHPSVTESWEDYQRAMTGVAAEESEEASQVHEEFSKETVLDGLARLRSTLLRGRAEEPMQRAAQRIAGLASELSRTSRPDYERFDKDLASIGVDLAETLRREMPSEELGELRREIRSETKMYKKRLDAESFARLEANFLRRSLLERRGLPEFSLFALERVA